MSLKYFKLGKNSKVAPSPFNLQLHLQSKHQLFTIYPLNGRIATISCVSAHLLHKCMLPIKTGPIRISLLYICVNLHDYARVLGIISLNRTSFSEGLTQR